MLFLFKELKWQQLCQWLEDVSVLCCSPSCGNSTSRRLEKLISAAYDGVIHNMKNSFPETGWAHSALNDARVSVIIIILLEEKENNDSSKRGASRHVPTFQQIPYFWRKITRNERETFLLKPFFWSWPAFTSFKHQWNNNWLNSIFQIAKKTDTTWCTCP